MKATTHEAEETTTALPTVAHGALWASLVYAVATLTLGWPALAGKFLVGPHSDQYIAGYAFREFAAATLRSTGAFPLWNPYQFGGMPFVAAMHGDIFYPTFLLRMVLPTDVAMTWGFIVHVFLAGLFTFLFLRRAGFAFGGAVVGGLAYMMSGHVATFVSPGHDGKLFVSALFPLLLWGVLAVVRDGRKWAIGALALIVGMDVLTPHPQLLQYSLIAAGAYAIVLAIGLVRDREADRRVATTRLAIALGAVALGLAIGAVQYLPVRGYVAWSPRAGGIGTYERATSFAKNPPEVLSAFLPEFTGILDHYWGQNGIHFQGDYAGAAVIVLAAAGLVGFRRDRRSRELWFWGITIVVSLLWSLGAHTPFFNIPFYLVPGTKFFRAPDTVFFVGTFGVALFAARGVERALAGEISRRFAIVWAAFAAVVALLAVTGLLTEIARSMAPEQRLDAVDGNAAELIVGAIRTLVVTAAISGLLWKGRALLRGDSRALLAAIAFVVVADLWSVNRQYWFFSPRASELYAPTPAIDYVKRLAQPSRVVALPMSAGESTVDFDGSGLMVQRVLNTLGYHGNEIARYNTLVDIPQGSGPSEDSFRAILGNVNVRRLTATQYALTNSRAFAQILPTAVQVAGPAADDPSGQSQYLYKLAEPAPFAWVAPVIVKAPDDAVLATVKDPRFDVATAALFAPESPVAGQTVTQLPPATGITTTVSRYSAGHITVALGTPAPAGSALVVAENFYPGWVAKVDGHSAPIGRAQYSLIGVPLPTGARTVTLDFTSPSYETGKLVTWLAIAAAAILLVGGLITERRSVV